MYSTKTERDNNMISDHYQTERNRREKFISEHLHGDGGLVDIFIVDKGHKNGIERHCVTDNGLIIIYNERTNKLITKKIARPQQIKNYYDDVGEEAPQWLLEICQEHKTKGYNSI